MGKSGLISTLVMTDALVVCPEDQEGLDAGQIVELHCLL
jgi:molybdopterin biosynthesis enzyme